MRPLGWAAACLTCPAAAAWPWSTGIYRTISIICCIYSIYNIYIIYFVYNIYIIYFVYNIYIIYFIYNIYRHVPGPDTWLGSAPQFHCTYHVVTDTRH